MPLNIFNILQDRRQYYLRERIQAIEQLNSTKHDNAIACLEEIEIIINLINKESNVYT